MEGDRPCLSIRRSWFHPQLRLPRLLDQPFTNNLDRVSSINQACGFQAQKHRRVKLRKGADEFPDGRSGAVQNIVLTGERNWVPWLSKTWSSHCSVKMLLITCLCSLLSTPGATAALECPRHCACVNSSTPWTSSAANSASPLADYGAFTAINCSNLDLTQYTLHFVVAKEYSQTTNQTARDDTGEAVDVQTVVSTMLQFLDLGHNKLTSTRPSADSGDTASNITFVIEVHHLDFSDNRISELTSDDLSIYKEVKSLDLSHNGLSWVDVNAFNGLETLTDLNLSHNDLHELANNTFGSLVNLQTLDLSFNTLSVPLLEQLQALSSLQYLYLNNNHLHPVINLISNVFPPLPNLVLLDLSNNPLEVILPGMFHSIPSLTILDMTNCSLQELEEYSLKGLVRLEQLKLDHNDITTITKPIFRNTSLTNLSIAFMPNLANISHDAFLDLSQLAYLNLSHNQELNFLQPNLLVPLTSLQVLDLSYSSLTLLSEITFHKNKDLAEVHLLHNPFSCSCVNAWLARTALENQTKFVDISSLQCLSVSGELAEISNASTQCKGIRLLNTSSEVSATLGTQLLLKCQYEAEDGDEPNVMMWTTPSGVTFYHHHFHPGASEHLLNPKEIQLDAPFHQGHYWHETTSYHSELSSFKDRVVILYDGSLYIDYMLRSDAGPYECQVSNAQYSQTTTIKLFVDAKLSTDVKICSIIVGLLCALGFFTLNVIYVIISWTARRLVNKRRREIIRQMLENLNVYKSTQITRIHENYTYQLGRVRNQYHIQRDRLHRNYTAQVARMKRGCSNQVERVRDNYHFRLNQLREYSSNQIMQIRERTNNQIARIRDYGSTQLDKLRETYKLQQQHVLKLLDTMNLDNCRNVVETECMRTESMMYDIDLLGEDERTDSPISPGESEYNTAASSPTSSLDDNSLGQDMAKQRSRDEHSDDSSENNGIILEMQTTIDMEGGLAVDVAERWQYLGGHERSQGNDSEEDTHSYLMNVRCTDGNRESLFHLQSDPSMLSDYNPEHIKKVAPLPIYKLQSWTDSDRDEAAASFTAGHRRSDSDSNWDGDYMTPEASPTKVWANTRGLAHFEEMDDKYVIHEQGTDMEDTQDLDSLSSETIV